MDIEDLKCCGNCEHYIPDDNDQEGNGYECKFLNIYPNPEDICMGWYFYSGERKILK